MEAKPECIICSLKQVLAIAGKITDDPALHKKALDCAMSRLIEQDPQITPAEIATDLFHLTCRTLQRNDPFRPEMDYYNQQALNLYPQLRRILESSADPVYQSLLMAVAGNLIDLGIISEIDVAAAIAAVLKAGLKVNDYSMLRDDLARADNLLYLADNAGEIVFDRLALEEIKKRYPSVRLTIAVKSGPAMNDALRRDAITAGLEPLGEIIETGAAYLGIPEKRCRSEFWERFAAAGVIIAKGHANFETIIPNRPAIYVLLRAKCAIVAAMFGVAVHDSVLKKLVR